MSGILNTFSSVFDTITSNINLGTQHNDTTEWFDLDNLPSTQDNESLDLNAPPTASSSSSDASQERQSSSPRAATTERQDAWNPFESSTERSPFVLEEHFSNASSEGGTSTASPPGRSEGQQVQSRQGSSHNARYSLARSTRQFGRRIRGLFKRKSPENCSTAPTNQPGSQESGPASSPGEPARTPNGAPSGSNGDTSATHTSAAGPDTASSEESTWSLAGLLSMSASTICSAYQGTTKWVSGLLTSNSSDLLPITNQDCSRVQSDASNNRFTKLRYMLVKPFLAIHRAASYSFPFVAGLLYLLIAVKALQLAFVIGKFKPPIDSWEMLSFGSQATSAVLCLMITLFITIAQHVCGEPMFLPLLSTLICTALIDAIDSSLSASFWTQSDSTVILCLRAVIAALSVGMIIVNVTYAVLVRCRTLYQGVLEKFNSLACASLAKSILHNLAPKDDSLKLTGFEKRTIKFYIKYFQPSSSLPDSLRIAEDMANLRRIHFMISSQEGRGNDRISNYSRLELGLYAARYYCCPSLTTQMTPAALENAIRECTNGIENPYDYAFPFYTSNE